MHAKRLLIIAFVVGAASLGIPTQVSAAPSIPKSLETNRSLIAQVPAGQTKVLSVPMPWRANMIGVSYVDAKRSSSGVVVQARVHDGGAWSAWEALDNGEPAADGAELKKISPRVMTDPLWVGTADGIQVSVHAGAQALHDVRIDLINTLGDSKPQNVVSRALHAMGGFLSMRASMGTPAAQAHTTQPTIISRARWGANPAYLNLPCPGIAPDLKLAFIHHTDTTNSYTKSQSAAIVRGIYAYHTNSRGFCDIGYNFLIDKYGQIFEGRNGGITNNVIGAHSGGYNYESFGVALIGQFSQAKPTTAMLNALTSLLAWRLDIAHVPAIGTVYYKTGTGNDHTKAGTIVRLNRISGHRDVSLTNCPGNYVYRLMSWIRARTAAIGAPKIYLPQLNTPLVRPDGANPPDEMVRFTAGFSTNAGWILQFVDPSGVVQRTFTGTGSAMKQYWNGTTDAGAPAPNGVYTWKLSAHDSTNHWATTATGTISIVTTHPDGTLLQDATGKYVIDAGAARSVDAVAYASNFGSLPAVATGPNERARYTTGTPLGLREGTLLWDGTNDYIWSDGVLHTFSPDSFTALGYAPAAAITVDPTYITSLDPLGADITSLTTHPDGTLVKSLDGKTFSVVEGGTLRPITALARASWYRSNEAVTVATGDPVTVGDAFPVKDGTFIKATDGGAPWIVSDGLKRRFVSYTYATYMGFTNAMMLTASSTDINAIPTGARIG